MDRKASTWWLREGLLGSDTEARMVAAKDGVIRTRAYEVNLEQAPNKM